MAATVEKLMLKTIASKMKRFSMAQLPDVLKFLHLNMNWEELMDKVSDCRLRPTVTNVVAVVQQYLHDRELLIEGTYHRLLLVDAIIHKSGFWWTMTVDKVNPSFLDKKTIRNNIQAMLNKLNIRAITYVMSYDELFWVLINTVHDNNGTKRRKTSTVKLNSPCFFTVAPGPVSYLFHRPHKVDNRLLKIMMKSIGATKCNPYPLSGKDLQSMVGLLADKENKQDNDHDENDHGVPTEEGENVQEYVDRLFGDKCRVLNHVMINAECESLLFDNAADLEGTTHKIQVELKGDNVMKGVRDMMLSGALQLPYPSWAKKLPQIGTNCVDVKIHV